MIASMPIANCIDGEFMARFALTQETITNVRNIRQSKGLSQREELELHVIADANYYAEFNSVLAKMANVSVMEIGEREPSSQSFIVKTTEYFVPLADKIDVEAEMTKIAEDIKYLEGFLASVEKKLSNERFVQSAPAAVVETERAKQSDAIAKIAALKERLEALKN